MQLMTDKKWDEFAAEAHARKDGVVLFGGSSCADIFFNKLKEKFKVKYIVDNDKEKWNKCIPWGDLMVYAPDKLREAGEEEVLLITSTYYEEIISQLEELGFAGKVYSFLHLRNKVVDDEKKRLLAEKLPQLKEICADEKSRELLDKIYEKRQNEEKDYRDICEGNQYFVEGIMEPDENEVFIDGGAFDGGTVREAIRFDNNRFKKIYSFEMDRVNYDKIPKDEFDERVEFYNYGLWDVNEKVSFIENKNGSEIADDGNASAECITLDGFVKEKVTFIKMDIEGAELRALKGAARIIAEDKPKLAICLYHKQEDLWEIPFYIHELVPEYQIYIRHHSHKDEETVMYAHI